MEYRRSRRRPRPAEVWDAARLQALRRHLGVTQQQLADELGMRQQTISEWETGVYQPRGASARLLGMIAERAGFEYETGPWVVGRGSPEGDDPEPSHD
jgi:DNA-binding transcriptional regulator YiaG